MVIIVKKNYALVIAVANTVVNVRKSHTTIPTEHIISKMLNVSVKKASVVRIV